MNEGIAPKMILNSVYYEAFVTMGIKLWVPTGVDTCAPFAAG